MIDTQTLLIIGLCLSETLPFLKYFNPACKHINGICFIIFYMLLFFYRCLDGTYYNQLMTKRETTKEQRIERVLTRIMSNPNLTADIELQNPKIQSLKYTIGVVRSLGIVNFTDPMKKIHHDMNAHDIDCLIDAGLIQPTKQPISTNITSFNYTTETFIKYIDADKNTNKYALMDRYSICCMIANHELLPYVSTTT